jgi:hypothetical protein
MAMLPKNPPKTELSVNRKSKFLESNSLRGILKIGSQVKFDLVEGQ